MEELPTKDKKDHIHKATKVGLNFIPIAGGALAEIFETVFSAPIDKRKEEWLKRLAVTIDELCEKVEGLTPEKLSNNPEFISIYLQASNIAIRTHQEEKLNMLNIAVKNSVIQENLDESKKMIFLRLVDQMTPLHIKVFHFLSFTNQYVKELNNRLPSNIIKTWSNVSSVWNESFKDINAGSPLINLITNDLYNYGLIDISVFHKASMDSVATGLGREFFGFITETT